MVLRVNSVTGDTYILCNFAFRNTEMEGNLNPDNLLGPFIQHFWMWLLTDINILSTLSVAVWGNILGWRCAPPASRPPHMEKVPLQEESEFKKNAFWLPTWLAGSGYIGRAGPGPPQWPAVRSPAGRGGRSPPSSLWLWSPPSCPGWRNSPQTQR